MKIQFAEVGHREYEFIFKTEEDGGTTRKVVEGAFLAALAHQVDRSAEDNPSIIRVVHRETTTWAGDNVTELIFRLRC